MKLFRCTHFFTLDPPKQTCVLYLWSENCLRNWQVPRVRQRRWRDAGPEPPHRPHGPPGYRWTARAPPAPSWTRGFDSDVSNRGGGGGSKGVRYAVPVTKRASPKDHGWVKLNTSAARWEMPRYSLESQKLGTAVYYVLQVAHPVDCGWLDCLRKAKRGTSVRTQTNANDAWQRSREARWGLACYYVFLTLNAEEVLPCVHGQAGLVAGWCQCCDVTRKNKNATEYQKIQK